MPPVKPACSRAARAWSATAVAELPVGVLRHRVGRVGLPLHGDQLSVGRPAGPVGDADHARRRAGRRRSPRRSAAIEVGAPAPHRRGERVDAGPVGGRERAPVGAPEQHGQARRALLDAERLLGEAHALRGLRALGQELGGVVGGDAVGLQRHRAAERPRPTTSHTAITRFGWLGGVADDLGEHGFRERCAAARRGLHRLRGGSSLLRKSEATGGRDALGSRHELDPTDARGPAARRRRDALRRPVGRSSPARPSGTGVDHDAGRSRGRASPCSPRRRSPCAAARRCAVLLATAAGILLRALFGYAVAASGLGPVFATTSAAYLTDRRGAIAGRRDVRRRRASPRPRSRCTASPAPGVQLITDARARRPGDDHRRRPAHAARAQPRARGAARASRRARPSPRIACASPATCTTSSATRSPGSRCRPGPAAGSSSATPRAPAEALREIDELATRALSETRETIGLIRAPDQPAELRPQPRLEDLDELVARLQRGRPARPAAPARATRSASRRSSRPRRTGSCRRRSATSSSTPGPRARSSTVAVADGALELDVRDDGRRFPRRRRPRARAERHARARRPVRRVRRRRARPGRRVARARPAAARAADAHEHPGPDRRRPGDDPPQLPRAAGVRAGHRGRRATPRTACRPWRSPAAAKPTWC